VEGLVHPLIESIAQALFPLLKATCDADDEYFNAVDDHGGGQLESYEERRTNAQLLEFSR
jgi:hypothetical protein